MVHLFHHCFENEIPKGRVESDGSFSCEKSFPARTQSDPKNFNGAGMTPLLKWSWSRHSVGPQRSARDRDVENHGTMVASWWCTFWYSWMPGCCCFQCSRWKNTIIFGQKLPESKVQHTSSFLVSFNHVIPGPVLFCRRKNPPNWRSKSEIFPGIYQIHGIFKLKPKILCIRNH